jgi:hypothetical protein
MECVGTDAIGLAVDFPGGAFGDPNSAEILLCALKRLRSKGHSVDVIFGPSGAAEVFERVSASGPFDAIFIDADHSYSAVERDFRMYSPLARMVILHDIAAPPDVKSKDGRPVDVPLLWKQLARLYPHEEVVAAGSLMGIGVIYRS